MQDAETPYAQPFPPRPVRRRWLLPLVLFVVTCWTTYAVGGLAYSISLMLILTAHELGHFFQAVRYRVPASFPYFIPIPAPPLGTMGAVIGMQAHVGDRKALFDIAITGPLAGLVPAIICSVIGLQLSEVIEPAARDNIFMLGEPLLFQWMGHLVFGTLPEGQDLLLHPMAFAGWVGLFITALNLIPISQLDGGHILYALLRRKAHPVATGLLLAAVAAVVYWGAWQWILLISLLFLIGPKHPPTADDYVPLGSGRILLGWLTLAFIIIGFTPTPFKF